MSIAREDARKVRDDLSYSVSSLLAELEANREKALSPIEPDLLPAYEKLRKTRRGVAVSQMKDGGCSVCGANLSAAQAQAARSPSKITYCDVCGRILYA